MLSQQGLESVRPYAQDVRWCVVENGVPLRDESPATADDALTLLFLGQVTERKGAYDLVAALECRPPGCAAAAAAGGGEVVAGQRERLEERVAKSPCAGQIRLLGLVQGDDKERAFEQANCTVLPSYAEGLPMASWKVWPRACRELPRV